MTRTRPARPPRRVSRWVTSAGLAVVLAGGLAGCAADEAGAAAVVDGRRISVGEVEQASTDLEQFSGQAVAPTEVLYFLVIAPFVVDAASQAGVGVSANEISDLLKRRVSDPSAASVEVLQAARAGALLNSLGEDRAKPALDGVASALREASIEISPRYGEFDRQRLGIVPPQENWIADPEAPSEPAAPQPSP